MTDNPLTVTKNHLEPGHPDNPKPFAICGARTKQDESNYVCTQRAGWGTSHPGEGRCKLHGGSSLSGPRAGGWKSGRYAHVWKGELARHFAAIQADDTDPLDLLPELEVQRTLLAMFLDKIGGQPASQVDENINSRVAIHSDSDDVIESDMNTSDGGVGHLSLLGSHVSNPRPEFLRISPEDLDTLRLLSGDIVTTVTKIIAARNQTALTKAEIVWLMSTLKEGIELFVPREKQGAFVQWLKARIPIAGKGEESE